MAAAHAGSKLRELLQTEFLILPGAFNGISARLAAKNGFRSLYLSGKLHLIGHMIRETCAVSCTKLGKLILTVSYLRGAAGGQ